MREDRGRELARHRRYLLRRARLHLGQPELAEDVVQETLLAAYLAFDRFDHRSTIRTWLVGILQHKIVDAIRLRVRQRSVGLESVHSAAPAGLEAEDDTDPPEGTSESPGPESSMDARELFAAIEGHLEGMPAKHAAAFVMRDVMDHSSDYICAALGITSNNLLVMLHRTRRSLRRTLEARGFQRPACARARAGAAR